MLKVIHLVPYDGVGGVETAARSMKGHSIERVDFQVEYVFPTANLHTARIDTFNPWYILGATWRVLKGKPDILIVSLWRSCIVASLAKLFSRHMRLVLFLHLPSDAHWLDRLLTRYVAARSDFIWADSHETLKHRLPSVSHEGSRVISFVTRRIAPLSRKPVQPGFIFWGRLHPQKGLDRALGIFSAVYNTDNSARFVIIGPDGGDCERIRDLANTLGLGDVVSFMGELDFNAISQQAESASFYLQTSTSEGMAMSVVEGMQLGLVPIVTPVGEIGNYCKNGENALEIQDDETIVHEILTVLNDDSRYQAMRKCVLATWDGKPLYAESILQACADIGVSIADKPRFT